MKLLYPSNRAGNADIYLLNADGSDPKNLTDNPAADTDPAWSPDGKQIAFVSDRNGSEAIYVMDADGRNVRQLTKEDNVADRTPAWSPDGKRLAFRRQLGNDWEIFVMDADGSNQTNLTNAPPRNADPAWSPDGKKIAFTSRRNGKGFSVYVMDPDGSNVRDVSQSDNPRGYVYPAWSLDGKQLVYTDLAGDALEIFVCNLDGSANKQLTKEGGTNTHAACSPDGKKIAFQHFDPNDVTASLYLMDATGENVKEILKGEGLSEGGRPAWKPK
jgi:TolB protein